MLEAGGPRSQPGVFNVCVEYGYVVVRRAPQQASPLAVGNADQAVLRSLRSTPLIALRASRTVGFVWWIVDAMNVIGSRPDGWWRDRRGAIVRLVEQLDRWAAGGHRVTVVLEKPMSPPITASVVQVAHAPRAGANSADDEIVRLVQAAPEHPQQITVVTSDVVLADRVRNLGAAIRSAASFRVLFETVGG